MAWWKKKSEEETKKPASQGRTAGSVIDQVALEALFHECCENAAPVVILSSEHRDCAYQGRFAKVSGQQVTIDLIMDRDQKSAGRALKESGLCTVAFNFENRSYVFLSEVTQYVPLSKKPANLPKIIISLPAMIAATESRTSFRVPVTTEGSVGLTVMAHSDQQSFPVKPIDLSLTGMLVMVTEGAPKLAADQRIGLELTCGDESVKVAGVIVPRSQPDLYGIYFPDVLRGAHIIPPPALREILSTLERAWLVQTVSE